ncbi:endonuclease III [Phanerochaete sordida]|uniref:Endonuclease III homolog n=1 Tax=Phanerochaete sordida TaxID=48140 RepID=A0A9P3G2Y0_9APHY|nr:endonuclease III [Phanerochaete sordida]
MKRAVSTELIGKPSPFSSSVTLFEPGPSTPRRSKRLKIESEVDQALVEVTTIEKKKTVTKRTRQAVVKVEETESVELETKPARPSVSPRKQKPVPQSLAVPHPAPPRWREQYEAIKRMRENIVAPVDTMGCEQAQLKEADPRARRFSTLVSLMLSSQTKDEVTDAAVAKLRAAVGGTLTVEAILAADEATIAESIAKVGFWRRKTQYIKQTAQKLKDDFGSDVPKTVDELCSLPGVGPKMSFLCLHVAWNINVGIGVDVHVHRITNRLGWHKPPTKTPEETRLNLQSWLPKELHAEINHRLVGFGQVICQPARPRCESCDLSDGLCPSAKIPTKRTKKIKVEEMTLDHAGPKLEIEVELENVKPSLETLDDLTPPPPSP